MDKTFCIFGDSVTQAAYIRNSWVELFRNYFEQKFPNDFINVFNLGIGGNTSDDILKRFKTESEAREPTDIIFAFGVNDSGYFKTPDKPIVPEHQFAENIKILAEQAKKFTNNITFVGLALGDESLLKPFPGSSQGKSYQLTRVTNFNEELKRQAIGSNCQFIQLLDKLISTDFSDGLHPNEQGHLKMFNEIKKWF